jgi:hypothetical protein
MSHSSPSRLGCPFLLAFAVFTSFGCSRAPATPGPTEEAQAKLGGAPQVPWADMNMDQRKDHMKKVVLPRMRELFVEAEGQKHAGAKCTLCHGEGAKDGTYKLPNPDLPRLSTTGTFEEELAEHPNGTKFMMEKVVPEMARLLGVPPYDAQSQSGFGCFSCHLPK